MGTGAVLLVAVVAIILGAAAQFVRAFRGPRTGVDGVIVAVVALVLGLFVGSLKPYGPNWDGLYVVPAILAAIVWSTFVAWLLRYVGRPTKTEE